ncbi:P-loop containing nucleoside triphosphate hydrolase protein [Apiospora kogelbergensis]|uniref:P-loop containing nucleoside triphosphate hydrolase protein n=1 Tax=Apiospora kogelbergensis TaxID=1337665 RepID=A0AAW0QYZ5_9PEZI
MADISLDTAALDQLRRVQKALLNAIDGLRKHRAGRFVDLPQIIVVGDQSSDLPGFYHSEDDTQFAAGHDVVNRLAKRYMKKKNIIILAIVSAQNQLIMRKVMSKVKLHEKNKDRTRASLPNLIC